MSGITVWFTLALSCVFFLAGCATTTTQARTAEVRTRADRGQAAAQFELAAMLDNGPADTTHDAEAAVWYRKAAEQGHAGAQNSLGSLYQFGHGVPHDLAEAVRWYQQAAAQGSGKAYTNLGYLYDGGLGIAQDQQKAVELYKQGAEQGSLTAMLNLGVSYWRGEGVSKDLIQAYQWLELARFYTQHISDMQLKWRIRGPLDEVKREMTAGQIRQAEQVARAWDAAHRSR